MPFLNRNRDTESLPGVLINLRDCRVMEGQTHQRCERVSFNRINLNSTGSYRSFWVNGTGRQLR